MKIGIIGCGNILEQYAKFSKQFDNLEVTRLADLNADLARSKADEYGYAHGGSVDELLADPEVELVINLTIPAAHAAVSKQVLNAGKHVYSEKPIAVEVAEAEEVIELAAQKNLVVGNAPDTVLGTSHQTVRKLVDDGAIGRPLFAVAQIITPGVEGWHPNPVNFYKRGAGPLFDMGPYFLTALMQLLGPISRVSAEAGIVKSPRTAQAGPNQGQSFEVETPDHISSSLRFAGGAIGTLVTSFAGRFRTDSWDHPISLYGTDGTLKVPDPNHFQKPILIHRLDDEDWTEVPDAFDHPNGRSLGVSDMIDAIHEGRKPRASAEMALSVLRTMHGILESSDTGRAVEIDANFERPPVMNR